MHNFFKLFLVLLFALILKIGDATADTAPPDNCEVRPYDRGRLWQVSKSDIPASYIFGTMHSKDPRILYLPGIIMQAFINSSVIILETSLNEKKLEESRAIMFGSPPYSLKQHLGEERFNRLNELTSLYGFNEQSLDRLKIWAAAAIISQPPQPRHSGEKALTLLDRELEKSAYQQKKSVYPLESMLEQLTLFDQLDVSAQTEYLDEAMRDFPNQEKEIARISNYYLAGRTGWIFCVLEEGLKNVSQSLAHFMKEDLISDRNSKMVQRMLPLIEKGGAFVAIGALHLPGDEGIIARLKKQGYKIERKF